MRAFARLYLALDATNSVNEKRGLIADFFREQPTGDAGVALYFLSGGRLERAASSGLIRAAALERTGLPGWMLDECREATGDLSEAVALLVEGAGDEEDRGGSDESFEETWARRLDAFQGAADDVERRAIIERAWDELDAERRLVFHKLVRGGFRVGVQRKTVARALADLTGLDVALITQRLTQGVEPTAASYLRVTGAEGSDGDVARPVPFCLANPIEPLPADREPGDEGERAAAEAAWVAMKLGDRAAYQAEWKYDGIRAQLVRHGGETLLWSRGEEDVTHQFPEVVSAARALPAGLTLDGELLLVSGDGVPRPFAELQTRLNRKPKSLQQPTLFEDRRAVFVAYDVVRIGEDDVRGEGTAARRGRLAGLMETVGEGGAMVLAPVLEEGTWEGLARRRAQSRGRNVEGLMLKHVDAPYHSGRTRVGETWWKWKVDPLSVDAVLVYAQAGSGRRATLMTDYTFALWSRDPAGDGDGAELVTFAKAYSGLTQEEIERVDRWVRRHTVERMGPVRKVEPELVFEVGYDGVQRSERHGSGISVRFPRMLRWRRDKRADEADTLAVLEGQLSAGSGGG